MLSHRGLLWSELFKLHLCRINLDANSLYPVVSCPVPVGTPMISPLVQWDHSQVWDIPKVEHFSHSSGGSKSAAVYNIGKIAVFYFVACVLIPISHDSFFFFFFSPLSLLLKQRSTLSHQTTISLNIASMDAFSTQQRVTLCWPGALWSGVVGS